MKTRTRIAAISLAAAALATGGASAAFAGSSDIPVPSGSDSALVVPQGGQPTQLGGDRHVRPTPTPSVNPQRNPFRNCRFAVTQEFTFAQQLGRFVREDVPSIVCITRRGGVQVYTLSGPGAF